MNAPAPSSAGKTAAVNGIRLYYEIHGAGHPLILLHGGLGSIGMFGPVLPLLAQGRQVVAVDLQAHGRTADIDRPIRLEWMADDVAALIGHLGLSGADVMGYSMGGGTACQLVIRHPEVVRKAVLVSFPYQRAGWYPEVIAGMEQMGPAAVEPMKQSPMYQGYAAVAPRLDDWPVLLTKMGEMLRIDYDYAEAVKGINAPVLLVVGDADSVRTSHAVSFFELLGGGRADGAWDGSGMSKSRLAVLPGQTHYTIFNSPALAAAVIPFLDGS